LLRVAINVGATQRARSTEFAAPANVLVQLNSLPANHDGKADVEATTMPSKEDAEEVEKGGDGEGNEGGSTSVKEEGTV